MGGEADSGELVEEEEAVRGRWSDGMRSIESVLRRSGNEWELCMLYPYARLPTEVYEAEEESDNERMSLQGIVEQSKRVYGTLLSRGLLARIRLGMHSTT